MLLFKTHLPQFHAPIHGWAVHLFNIKIRKWSRTCYTGRPNSCMLLPPSQNDCPIPGFFRPKMIVRFLPSEEFEAESQMCSCQTFYIKKSFATATSRSAYEWFFFEFFFYKILRVILKTTWLMVSGPYSRQS